MPNSPENNEGYKAVLPAHRNPPSEVILTVALEGLAVAVFTLIAGAGDDMGSIMVVLMVGFWLMYLIQNASVLDRLNIALKIA
jgi:hypothetical protein